MISSKETGIDRNPADQVEVCRPDDQRERYLSAEEIGSLKRSLDQTINFKSFELLDRVTKNGISDGTLSEPQINKSQLSDAAPHPRS